MGGFTAGRAMTNAFLFALADAAEEVTGAFRRVGFGFSCRLNKRAHKETEYDLQPYKVVSCDMFGWRAGE